MYTLRVMPQKLDLCQMKVGNQVSSVKISCKKLFEGSIVIISENAKHEKCRYECQLSPYQPVFELDNHKNIYKQNTEAVLIKNL